MSVLWSIVLGLSLLSVPLSAVWSRSFPDTPDATEAAQQRWGSMERGGIVDGCVLAASATTTVTFPACRAFILDSSAGPALKGVTDTAHALTLSGGDGRYWLGLRDSPGRTVVGWTCTPGFHSCWTQSATPPVAVPGLLPIATTLVTSGASSAGVIMAPWHRTTPYVVPVGTTLIFGVCPVAGRWQLWDANGVTSGLVRFGPGACAGAYPEWWGADPTGLAPAHTAWQAAIDAVSGELPSDLGFQRVPLECAGSYRLEGTLTVRSRLTVHGKSKVMTSGVKTVACEFLYYGTGTVFVGPDLGISYNDMEFRSLRVIDVNETANYAFWIVRPSGLTMDNVYAEGFATPWFWQGQLIYGRQSRLQARFYRQRCMDISGPANFADIDVACGASRATVTEGVRVGLAAGVFATSTGLTLRASVEAASGLPIAIARVNGINADLYVEQPGACSAYSTFGAVSLTRILGGQVHLTTTGNCTGGPPGVPRGLYILNPGDPDYANARQLLVTGYVADNYLVPVVVDGGEGMWGINLSGLAFDVRKSILADFSTGILVGGAYWTHGGAPMSDQGPSSTTRGTLWPLGSLVWNQGAANQSANLFWQVLAEVNPPPYSRLLLITTTDVQVAGTVAAPDIRVGNTFHTRLSLEAGATAVSDIQSPIDGLCVDLQALGTRTVQHSATLHLQGSANFAMTAGNTLRLCAAGATGPWIEMSRCASCTL